MAFHPGTYGLVPSEYITFGMKLFNPLIFSIVQIVLFGADLVQALGAVMDIRWAHTGIVVTGTYCTAQGNNSYAFSYNSLNRPPQAQSNNSERPASP
jgi:hypothetical protein